MIEPPIEKSTPVVEPAAPRLIVVGVPGVLEVSIGHALVSDALELGYAETVRQYLAALSP